MFILSENDFKNLTMLHKLHKKLCTESKSRHLITMSLEHTR